MKRTTTLSVVGDEVFKSAVRQLAAERGVEISVIVREALDKTHGRALEPLIAFFASRGASEHQTVHKNSKRKAS